MKSQALRYHLRLVRTPDGQLRIALESATGQRRFFRSLEQLTAFLKRQLPPEPGAGS